MDKSNRTRPTTQAEKRPRSPSSSACSDRSEESSHDSVNQRLLVPTVLATAVSESLADTATRLSLGSADLPSTVKQYVDQDARESLGERLADAFVEQRKNADRIASSLRSTIRRGVMGEGLSALLIPHHVVPAIVSQHVVLPWWHRPEKDMRVSWKSWELVSYLCIDCPVVFQLMPSSVFRTVQALAIRCEVLPASDHVFAAVVHFDFSGPPDYLNAWLSRVPGATTASFACAFDAAAVEVIASANGLRSLTLEHRTSPNEPTPIDPLVKLSRLESLSLEHFDLNATNTEAFKHSIQRLETLSVRCCCVPLAFVAAIATVTTLRTLDLGFCRVTDEHIQTLSAHPALTSLDVAGNDTITDEALRHIALLPRLSRLDVSFCRALSDTGVGFLVNAPALREVNLSHTHVHFDNVEWLLRRVGITLL